MIKLLSNARYLYPRALIAIGLLLFLSFSSGVQAQEKNPAASQQVSESISTIPGLPALTLKTNADGSQEYNVSIQILAVMTLLTFCPHCC